MTEVEREPALVSTRVILSVHLAYPSLVSRAATTTCLAETKRYQAASLVALLAICYCLCSEMYGRRGYLPAMSDLTPASSSFQGT
eukprot:COSAG02_NODE_737_length_17855_cov_18.729049_6_plen_85_part_00